MRTKVNNTGRFYSGRGKRVTFVQDPYIRERIIRAEIKKWLANEITYTEMKKNVDNKVEELIEVFN